MKRMVDIRFWGALAGVLFWLASAAGGQGYDEAEGFRIAAAYLKEGKYLEAISTYQEIARNAGDPDSQARALLFVGQALNRYLDQYDAALGQFEYIRFFFPRTPAAPDALFTSGTVAYERGRFGEAHRFFQAFIAAYPDHMRRQAAEMWARSAREMVDQGRDAPPRARIPFGPETRLRVLLAENAPSLSFAAPGGMEVVGGDDDAPLYSGPGPLVLTRTATHMRLNGQRVAASTCRIAVREGLISLDGRRYRGGFTVTNQPEGLSVVNTVGVEDYLYGVVPKEMNPSWPPEALKAQAVAARTYALYIREKNAGQPFELKATTLSQVYGGYDAEQPAANRAVDATRGEVITHGGKLVIAYFHSDSGGHTEDAGNVWNAPVPYLTGKPDPFHPERPSCAWEHTLPLERVREGLNRHGYLIGRIGGIAVDGRTPSGRARHLRIHTREGEHLLTANNFRLALGAREVKSTLFDVETVAGQARFRGRGYGHGVGLCQSGARRMAETGHGYRAILKHYYEGIGFLTLRGD